MRKRQGFGLLTGAGRDHLDGVQRRGVAKIVGAQDGLAAPENRVRIDRERGTGQADGEQRAVRPGANTQVRQQAEDIAAGCVRVRKRRSVAATTSAQADRHGFPVGASDFAFKIV